MHGYYGTLVQSQSRTYALLGSIIASNLVPWVLEKIFLLEIVKIGICLGGASKQMPLFQKNVPPKNRTYAPNV